MTNSNRCIKKHEGTFGLWRQHSISIWMLVAIYLAQPCLTLCDPMEYSLPGSSVHVYNRHNSLICSLNICAFYYIFTSIIMYIIYVTFVSLSLNLKEFTWKWLIFKSNHGDSDSVWAEFKNTLVFTCVTAWTVFITYIMTITYHSVSIHEHYRMVGSALSSGIQQRL